jgi:putative SOS response-associated peptidase YedK
MCYSAMVKRDLDKIAREFGAAIDTDAFIRLYMAREKDLSLKIPYGMDRYFIEKGGATGRTIEKSIKAYKVMEDARKKQELEDLEAEIKEIEARLKVKVTKTHQKALDVKGRKREKLLAKAESAVATSETKDSYRIYPFYFSPVIMVEKTARIITPMRYRILPRTGVEIPSKYNVFNARRDSLLEARTWKQTFSKQHAIFPFVKFYEWVEQKARKVEISFSPDGFESMWAASLFEEYKSPTSGLIRSFAMVTDDPPKEVAAAGHDRCPVFIEQSKMDDWLNPEGQSLKTLDALLDHKQKTYYSHVLAA